MNFLSNLLIIYIPILIIAWFIFRKNKVGLKLLLVSAVSVIISVVLKEFFKTGVNETSQGFQLSKYSFPSLSVQLAVVFWFYLSLCSKKIIIYILTSLIAVFVAYEKLISDQHSLLDIVVGACVGVLIVFIFIRLNRQEGNSNATL